MQKALYAAVFLLSIPLIFSCRHNEGPAPVADTLVFVMAGQSNMAGRGGVEAQDQEINPAILEMDDLFILHEKKEPNTIYQGSLAGLDCGLSFGNALLSQMPEGTAIVLIQCSISSTSIQQWLGDSLRVVKLYSNMLERSRAGLRRGKLAGVLWLQGEENAGSGDLAAGYDKLLSALVSNFRRDIGQAAIPFYVGYLPSWCKRPFTDSVNAGIRRASTSLANMYVVPTDDLHPKGDSLHLDSEGQRTLGRRFATLVLQH